MTKYQQEGKRRILIRQANRKQKWSEKVSRYGRGSELCPYCNSYMTWCSICQKWSSKCCIDYGTCQCS